MLSCRDVLSCRGSRPGGAGAQEGAQYGSLLSGWMESPHREERVATPEPSY